MKELNIKLTINELNLVLEALGNLPYIRVYELINEIQQQAKKQIDESGVRRDSNPKMEEGAVASGKAEMHAN